VTRVSLEDGRKIEMKKKEETCSCTAIDLLFAVSITESEVDVLGFAGRLNSSLARL